MITPTATWPSVWPAEDGGPQRLQSSAGLFDGLVGSAEVEVRHRDAPGSSMVVLRDPGEVYLLGHGLGPDVDAWVERLDPDTLEPLARVELPGGPTWPGGIAAHADGSLHACSAVCPHLAAVVQ